MNVQLPRRQLAALLSDYGMLVVLLALGVLFSVLTWAEQHPTGQAAARQLSANILREFPSAKVLIVTRNSAEDRAFAAELAQRLQAGGAKVIEQVHGQPADARRSLGRLSAAGEPVDVIVCNNATAAWGVFDDLGEKFPALASAKVQFPRSYYWPNFLKSENLLNIANQIAVIAIIAIGMTMVIITGGIDLSVGSLVALAAVIAARLIRDYGSAQEATAIGMTLACLAGIACCGLIGGFSGSMVTFFRIPPFIATLAVMLIASGMAFIVSGGQSINQVPDSFVRLGRGADLFGIPNAVVLMLVLYAAAHVFLSRMVLGRYIYAVGGNRAAARLSGVSIGRVLLFVYIASGVLAGLGGIVTASQLKSGTPTYGVMYELYVIAAVVVGGTSLAGGQGRIFGTLIGALIIAVIQNGMNLTGVDSFMQKVLLGTVILAAVLLDNIKRGRGEDVG